MKHAIAGTRLGTPEVVAKILAKFEEGANEETAALHGGIGGRTIYKWLARDPVFRQLVLEAKARAKQGLLESVRDAGTKTRVVKETRSFKRADKRGEMVEVEREEIEREVPPDWKASMAILKAQYPEEFGDIKRVDIRKIGGTDQVDAQDEPSRPKDPLSIINMMLSGDGSYVSEYEADEEPPEDSGVELEDEEVEAIW